MHIKAPKNWYMLLFLPVWLAGWTLGGITIFVSAVRGTAFATGTAPVAVWSWLCMWLLGELFVLYTLAWMLRGQEVISVSEGKLTIKRDIFGWGPTKTLDIRELHNLRASGYFGSLFSWNYSLAYWGLTGGTVAVDWQGKPQRFGIQLSEGEANLLVQDLKPYLQP